MEEYFQSAGANPKLNADTEFWRRCEMGLAGPYSFWKS